jgi:hypothetical protein
VKRFSWKVSSALTTKRASPDNMSRRHDSNGDGFPAPFASQDRLRRGFQVHHVSQFRRMKNECLEAMATIPYIQGGRVDQLAFERKASWPP